MARKVHLDDKKKRRREDRTSPVCEIEEIRVANPRYLSEETENALADALFDVVIHPEKYKDLPDE